VTRVFRRGELQAAVLDALAQIEPANGYAVMQELSDRVGETWQPSPGAVYPALIGLHDAGLIAVAESDGAREYRLSAAGRRAASKVAGTLEAVGTRARAIPRTATIAAVVDDFAARIPNRHRLLTAGQEAAIVAELDRARRRVSELLQEDN
jgi:DNA-binding PadR family transcriptional regulator